MANKAKGTLYVLICVALWGLIPVVARMGQTSLDHHQFLFWSSLISFSVLFTNAYLAGELSEIKFYSLKDFAFITLLGFLGTYIYYLFLYLGYTKAKGLEVLVVQYTWPILIVVLSVFILKEKLTYKKASAITLGFFGVLIVLSKGELSQIEVSNPSIILLVGAGAFCFALFSVVSKTVKKTAIVVVSLYFLVALIASFISMHYFSEFKLPASNEIAPILINGIFVNGYSYIFWKKALQVTEASYLAPFTYIAPILSAIYLVLFFNEPFLMAYGVGLILIIASGLVNTMGKLK